MERNIQMNVLNEEGTYDILYPQTISSQVVGNIPSSQISGNIPSSQITGQFPASQINGIYTADETLTDAVASMFGLGTDAVPDEVLAYLGKYNQYWWRRIPSAEYVIDDSIELIDVRLYWSSGSTGNGTIYYYDNVSIDQSNGAISPSGTQHSVAVGYITYNNATVLRGKYFYSDGGTSGTLYYAPENAQITRPSSSSYYPVFIQGRPVVAKLVQDQNVEYVYSSNRSAYPDSGESGGYKYQYLGIPFENAVEVLRIAIGSYVGTGKYGGDNPNTLTFGFEPKIWGVYGMKTRNSNSITPVGANFPWASGNGIDLFIPYVSLVKVQAITYSGSTVSWYLLGDIGGANQLNELGSTYYYFAIG